MGDLIAEIFFEEGGVNFVGLEMRYLFTEGRDLEVDGLLLLG